MMINKNALLPKHMPALDGLRGIAILMVILTHAATGWGAALSIYQITGDQSVLFPGWLQKIASEASHGVQLFFVVSAFTLTCRSLGDIRGYALRRITRIGPGYWLAALVYTIVGGLAARDFAPDGIHMADILIACVFGSTWQGGAAMAIVPGGWTVCCEAAFYVALPFLLLAVDGRIRRILWLAFLVSIAVNLWARHLMLNDGWTFVAYASPLMQLPAFLYGIAAAFIAMHYRTPNIPYLAGSFLIFGIVFLPFSPVKDYYVLHHLLFAGLAAIVTCFAAAHPPGFLVGRLIRKTGEVSYSMYLTHFLILAPSFRLALWLLPEQNSFTIIAHYIMTVVTSFGVSCLTYKFIEKPAMRWAGKLSARWKAEPIVESLVQP